MAQFFAFEGELLLYIQEHVRNPYLTPVFTTITHLVDYGIIWILLTLILLLFKRTRVAGMCLGAALLFSLIINNGVIKNLAARTRPYEVIEGLRILVRKEWEYSFPSGHTASSFAGAFSLVLSLPLVTDRKKARILGTAVIILALLVMFSRLYVGVHYPSDVIFGMISGILCGVAGYYLGKYVYDRYLPDRLK